MQPADLRYVLEDLADTYDKMPIIITENGLADGNDTQRQWWLSQTIQAMYDAMAHGVPLLGYCHWSLLDNFEWDKGRWPRFGLYSVNYATMERTVRPSAVALGKIIKQMRGV
jgi:beta-glucosidase